MDINPWLVSDVVERFPAVQALALRCGYLASVFGSAIEGRSGRDLDVLVTALRGHRQDQARFLAEFGGQIEKRRINAALGVLSYEISKGGRLYHFVLGSVGDKPAR